MASSLYNPFKQQLLQGGVNLSSADIKAVIVNSAEYTPAATHEFLSDVPAAAREGTTGNLASKTFTNGAFDSANPTVTAASGDSVEIVVLYVDTGVEGTSRLISWHDGLTPASLTLNGGDVSIQVPAGGWFSL